ncbi:SPARC-related modular calcium-binding protein 1 [Nymphon striatum]|nr:SPARC-related modular calcium-binding protein 1 [Nymphon striatum]
MVGIFIPECNSDGTFKKIQCHASTGYCWCVNNHGKPIPGSSTARKSVDCDQVGSSSSRRTRPSRDKRRKNDCSSSDRTTFTKNLIKIFKSEYLRMPTKLTTERRRTGSAIDTIEKRVLEWKFSEIDKNGDTKLSRKELKKLKRMVKKIVKPKPCARTFTKHCDLDQDRKITRKEWSVCLWMDAKSEMNHTSVENANKLLPPTDNLSDASSLLNKQVDRFKNNESASTSTRSPNKAVTNPSSPRSGCPERRKRKFLRELLEFLKKEKANVTDYSIKVSDSSFRQSEQEQLVRWKFTQIDTNVNRLLDRKEWKPFRRVMKEHKNLRKCGRKFLRFCDENTDRKITIQEWLDCFNLNEAGFGSSSTARKGPNPFDTYLKD